MMTPISTTTKMMYVGVKASLETSSYPGKFSVNSCEVVLFKHFSLVFLIGTLFKILVGTCKMLRNKMFDVSFMDDFYND